MANHMANDEKTVGISPLLQAAEDLPDSIAHTCVSQGFENLEERELIESYIEDAVEEKVHLYVDRDLEKYERIYKLLLGILPEWDRLEAKMNSKTGELAAEKRVYIVHNYSRTASDDLKNTFASLTRQWKRETINLSSMDRICMNDAYQSIIGLGPDAVPLIFAALEQEADWWFWALRAITRSDPVTDDMRGNLMTIREAWLNWGREHGYVRDHSSLPQVA